MQIRHKILVITGAVTTLIMAAALPTSADEPAADSPAKLFVENCSACHKANGTGVPPVFPALTGSSVVTGDPTPLTLLVLAGRNGMPSFRNDLSSKQLADILSYVRTSWGNDRPPISTQFIQNVRVATGNEQSENPTMAN